MPEPLPRAQFDWIFRRVPRLTVEIVISSPERGVLLSLRDIEPCRGMWHLPGGTVRFGEPVADAVRRVAEDELGATVSVGALLGYIEYPSHYNNGLDSPVGLAFAAEIAGGEAAPRGGRWFTTLPDNMHDEQRRFLIRHGLVREAGASVSATVPPREHPVTDAGRARLRRTVMLGLGAAATGIGVAAVLSSAGGLGDVLTALGRVSAGWMLAAAAALPAGYALLALHLRRLAAGRLSIWQAARADLLLFGLGNVLPGAPAPGALLAARQLRRDGLSPRRTRLALMFTMWFNVRTLLGLGALAFLVAFTRQHPGVRESGLWWLAAAGVIIALAVTAAMAARQTTAQHSALLLARLRMTRPRPPAGATRAAADAWHAEAKATVGSPANRALLVALAAASWLADAACLWLALAAAGVQLDPDVVLLAYVAGIIVSALPLLPGGIGAVEAAIPTLLHHFGAPLDAALAGTLVYRGISMLLPAAAGALLIALAPLRIPGRH